MLIKLSSSARWIALALAMAGMGHALAATYTYDANDRLTGVDYGNGTVTSISHESRSERDSNTKPTLTGGCSTSTASCTPEAKLTARTGGACAGTTVVTASACCISQLVTSSLA
ncbi:MAG: hypothetical protein WCN95_16165 [bacterium]